LTQFKEDLAADVDPLSKKETEKCENKFANSFNKEYHIGYEVLLNVLMEERKANVKQ